MKSILMRALSAALIAALSGSLTGCGNKGPLAPPKALHSAPTFTTAR